jgi:hypothetical protein
MNSKKKLLSYDELLAAYPDWTLWRTDAYGKESIPEATEQARLRCLAETGYVVKFIQENSLTRHILCDKAPAIPDKFSVLLKDITPEGLEFYRTGYMQWLKRFERDMHADPADIRVLEKSLQQMRMKAQKAEL